MFDAFAARIKTMGIGKEPSILRIVGGTGRFARRPSMKPICLFLILSLSVAILFGCASGPSWPGISAPGAGKYPSAASPFEKDRVRRVMASLSLKEKIAQRFIVFLPRGGERDQALSIVAGFNPGGVILYRWNFYTSQDAARLIDGLQAASAGLEKERPGLFICVDQEGGRVAALRFPELVQFPSQASAAFWNSTDFVRALAYVNGYQLRKLGFNMNLAPVLDLSPEADDSIIGDRSFGNDPEAASRLGTAYVEGMAAAGVIPVIKHFPGHGSTRIDSHSRLPVVDKKLDELLKHDVAPFRAAVAQGAPAVMTAHIVYPALDPQYPATLSPTVIRDFLRRDLGFEGVVITDGFEMGALSKNFPVKEALGRALRASVDMILLYASLDIDAAIGMVEKLLAEGGLSEADIDEGVERVLVLKLRYGLLRR
jgi:beta-N-acetylhexosaminidase